MTRAARAASSDHGLQTARPFDLWLLDLVLTAVSFLVAYRARVLIPLTGHTIMPFAVYAPSLAVAIPIWAVTLPLFRVYSNLTAPLPDQMRRLGVAVLFAWVATLVAESLLIRMQLFGNWGSSRLILLFTLVIDCGLLASCRFLLLRRFRHELSGEGPPHRHGV
jgi:hypothetical protein